MGVLLRKNAVDEPWVGRNSGKPILDVLLQLNSIDGTPTHTFLDDFDHQFANRKELQLTCPMAADSLGSASALTKCLTLHFPPTHNDSRYSMAAYLALDGDSAASHLAFIPS
jgi:hypothetical protein